MSRHAIAVLPLMLFALGCGGGTQQPTPPAPAPAGGAAREERNVPITRVAELEIDPAQLEAYTAAVKEEMEASVRVEPGVLAIYCVAEKDHPARLRFFEVYADEAAHKAHLDSDHFKKYVATTKAMIVSRKLIDTVPVQLSVKPK